MKRIINTFAVICAAVSLVAAIASCTKEEELNLDYLEGTWGLIRSTTVAKLDGEPYPYGTSGDTDYGSNPTIFYVIQKNGEAFTISFFNGDTPHELLVKDRHLTSPERKISISNDWDIESLSQEQIILHIHTFDNNWHAPYSSKPQYYEQDSRITLTRQAE